MVDVELAIVGSGFGGSILAMIARQLGLRVALIERGTHPRFAIGESASPLAGAIIEQLAARYDLPRLTPLATYGAWCRAYPGVQRGLKRGFTYFKHEAGARYAPAADRSNQLLVAASPSDEVSDTHWLRADVDHFLASEAIALGAEYLDRTELESVDRVANDRLVLSGERDGRDVRVSARFVVDASGPRGFLTRALRVPQPGLADYPPTQALFSHFAGVAACADMQDFATADTPPYPIDAAALHHVFDQGWMWVLRFDNGVTSAGVAVTDALAAELRLADGAAAWQRILGMYPSIAAQFADAVPIREFTWLPRLGARVAEASGDGWAMLPSAAGFIDPLFSTGIPLTLLGIERLARLMEGPAKAGHYEEYSRVTLDEIDHTARFIAGCYAAFPRFERFVSYSMFYFAAASFSEMRRRLSPSPRGFGAARARPSRGFMLAADQAFAGAVRRGPMVDEAAIALAIDPVNIAGLCDPRKRNWYGVDFEDAVRGAEKLGATVDEIRAALAAFT